MDSASTQRHAYLKVKDILNTTSSNSSPPFSDTMISNYTQVKSQVPKQIFIFSGQSNMAGRAGVDHYRHWDGIIPPECRSDPSIFRLNAHLQWELAREPLHRDIDIQKTNGVGPGMPFANAVKERMGVVGLVPCAIGGTTMKDWQRGTHLYDFMVKRAKAALAAGGGEIRALFWYQGESDASSQPDAVSYKANMERFIHDFREDLGIPRLPVIEVAISSGGGKYLKEVREAQKGINVPNFVCVDSKGLPLKNDQLHLNIDSQIKLGHMLADAYLTHFAPRPPSIS